MHRRLNGSGHDVVVIGGGAIGVCAAHELARRGASVQLLERGPELAWGCSAGNAGIVGASHVLPLAGPEALWEGLRWMGRADSPFAIRPRPSLVPWIAAFVAASAPAEVRRAKWVLRPLAMASARMHADMAAAGLDTGYRASGLLNVFGSPKAFATARAVAEEDRADGLAPEVLGGPALAERFPVLAGTPAGGVLYTDEAQCDPGAFVRAVGAAAVEAGATVRTDVEVLGLERDGDRVQALRTSRGLIRADHFVLAAGVWSPELVDALPIALPIEGGKGYHVEVEPHPGDPSLPIWFHEDRVVITPMPGRLRVAGTLELGGAERRVDLRKVDAITAAWRQGLRDTAGRKVARVWSGLRPCTPDGLPLLGQVEPLGNLTVAAGHGMWGLQLAPLTGRLVGQLLGGETLAGARLRRSPAIVSG